jgi:hypothetical protein
LDSEGSRLVDEELVSVEAERYVAERVISIAQPSAGGVLGIDYLAPDGMVSTGRRRWRCANGQRRLRPQLPMRRAFVW